MRSLRTLLCLAGLFFTLSTFGQLNATLRSNLDYPVAVNDVWGYVAPDGTEYAIVGLDDGVSVVSLADPDNPVEVGRTAGANSPWRDMKTYGDFAYVTADRGADGLTVIDLRELPEKISYTNNLYDVPGFSKQFLRAHNIYIDTSSGLAFTAGGDFDVNDGGMLIFDLKANPERPPLVAVGPEVYSHDVYVRDSIMYASEIYRGELAIYDIHRLDSIVEVGRTRTPFAFTHNAWTTDDATTIFTTDERENASVTAFAIGDRGNIRLLDEYRPLTSENTGTIPHNVHVIDDYLSISYYTDGLRVVDASDPSNLIEIANYDTWAGPDGGFNGNWGAYPFLPSGLTLVSDRSTGLYVVDVDYKRAARLSGQVTDLADGRGVNNAMVRLLSEQLARDLTDATGTYQTGLAEAGTYQVVVSADGYHTDTLTVALSNGVEVTLDVSLEALKFADVELTVRDRATQAIIATPVIVLTNNGTSRTVRGEPSGQLSIPQLADRTFTVAITAWGYYPLYETANLVARGDRTVYLDRGYDDTFITDLGWSVSGDASRGNWERGVPEATTGNQGNGQPTTDADADQGNFAFMTGLSGGSLNENDVDGGATVLRSPGLDLANYGDSVRLSYQYWHVNFGVIAGGDDSLTVSMTNQLGDSVVLATYRDNTISWTGDSLMLDRYLTLTDSMYLYITAADRGQDGVVEAGFDAFRVSSLDGTVAARNPTVAQVAADIFPNPSARGFTLSLNTPLLETSFVTVYDAQGRRTMLQALDAGTQQLSFGNELPAGSYFLRVTDPRGRLLSVQKLLKQ